MPTPKRGWVQAIAGDARDLPTIPSGSVHLVVTSPPYPRVEQWDATFAAVGATTYDAMHAVLDAAWAAAAKALVDGGILAINIGDALRRGDDGFRLWPNHARVIESVERLGLVPLPYILWKKPTNKPNAFLGSGFLPPNAYVTLDCEFLLLFRKGAPRSYPPKDPARYGSSISKEERDRWFSQIWDDVRGAPQGEDGARTGAFPRAIPDRLIRMFSVVGETVLDPFAGTGTTLWAASEAGRTAIGVERDPAIAERLLDAVTAWNQASEALERPGGRRPSPSRDGRPPRRRRPSGTGATRR